MATVVADLQALLKLTIKSGEGPVPFIERLAKRANKIDDDDWATLEIPTQKWVNAALISIEEKKPIKYPTGIEKLFPAEKVAKVEKTKAPAKEKKQAPKPKPAAAKKSPAKKEEPEQLSLPEPEMLGGRLELITALERLVPALGRSKDVPELSHVWFTDGAMYAYDGSFGIMLDYATGLECGAPGLPLLNLLKTSSLKEVKLESKGSTLSIGFDKSTSKLAAMPAAKRVWGFTDSPGDAKRLRLGEDFIKAIERVLIVHAKPMTRVEHHGVTMQHAEGGLQMFCVDGDSCIVRSHIETNEKLPSGRVILPRDFAEQLVEQCPQGVDLYVLDDCLIADGEDVTLYSNLLDMTGSADLAAIMDGQIEMHGDPVRLPLGLNEALSRALILSGNEPPKVEAKIEKNALVLRADYGMGNLSESFKLDTPMEDAALTFRADQLKRALSYVDHFSMIKGSMLLQDEDGAFVYLVASM